MRYVELRREELVLSPELSRSRTSKQFEDRLRASIEEIGLAEPIKVARCADGRYLVVDGTMRLRAIDAIREADAKQFRKVAAYVVDFDQRFELRYQTDIYQDLLPSQMAALMEHLHEVEHVKKVDIGRYVGVTGPTVRNYTGLWRMMQRGGLFAQLVELMDLGVIPSSNPYAWLRLTDEGLRTVLEETFTNGETARGWIEQRIARARRGDLAPIARKLIDEATDSLPEDCYREDADVRTQKREMGLRRSHAQQLFRIAAARREAIVHLQRVQAESSDVVVQTVARSLAEYIQ